MLVSSQLDSVLVALEPPGLALDLLSIDERAALGVLVAQDDLGACVDVGLLRSVTSGACGGWESYAVARLDRGYLDDQVLPRDRRMLDRMADCKTRQYQSLSFVKMRHLRQTHLRPA